MNLDTIHGTASGRHWAHNHGNTGNTGNADDAEYSAFLQRVNERFAANTLGRAVFHTAAASTIWGVYLKSFPAADRQHHNCNTCRQFLEHFGALATIMPDGTLRSALWDEQDAEPANAAAVQAMRTLVERSYAAGVFLSAEKMLGQPKTGRWTHLAVQNPAPYIRRAGGPTAYETQAAKRQDFLTLQRAVGEFPRAAVDTAVAMLESEALFRSEKVLGPAKWLQRLQTKLAALPGRGFTPRHNHTLWRAVATAPAGYAHLRSSVLGSLLEDIVAGKSTDEVRRAFAAKMQPDTYQRPKAAPAAGNIAAAERAIRAMGLERSLERRYARLDEVQAVWRPAAPQPAPEGALFGHLRPKGAPAPAPQTVLPGQRMTWAKFRRTVLPEAQHIDLYAPIRGSYGALLTAVHPDAPPILQWDREDMRNPVSWYVYRGGSLASAWGLDAGWARVLALAEQPSMWNGADNAHQGVGLFFALEGARDRREPSMGLFPEILRSELHPYRATIEAFSRSRHPAGADVPHLACGIVTQLQEGSQLRVRVRTQGGVVRPVILDRWE